MRKIVKLATVAAIGALAFSLVACGTSTSDDGELSQKITVAATPSPHAEILEQVKPILAAEGYELEIKEYTDYVQPNAATASGEVDANFFQHKPYLDDYNTENGTDLISVTKVHYEPMGVFAGKSDSLDLADGASIAIPNDPTNEARALLLLQDNGLITIDPDAGLSATPKDITSNPKNLTFNEVEAAAVARQLADVDLGIINGNYALEAGLNPAKDAIASEDPDSEAAQTYANIIAVTPENEDNPAIVALVDALHSDAIVDYINSTYDGAVVPID